MPTSLETNNKETFGRFHGAMNSRDAEVIAKAIDEVVDPNLLFHATVPNVVAESRRSTRCG